MTQISGDAVGAAQAQKCADAPTGVLFPKAFSTNVALLRQRLASASVAVFDFETDGLDPHVVVPCGLGILLPETGEAFYINCGHSSHDDPVPLTPQSTLKEAIAGFFGDQDRLAIAHNALYDIRILFRMGVNVRCRVSCTQIRTHRCEENLDRKDVHHPHTKVSYGLKELTAIYFNEAPPTLASVVGHRNTMFASPLATAKYCIADVFNCWRLYVKSEEILRHDHRLRRVVQEIDEPNITLVAELMWNGIGVDLRQANKQEAAYLKAIDACRSAIWAKLRIDWPLRTRDQLREVLRHLDLGVDLDFDPFYMPEAGEAEPTLGGEKIAALIPTCSDRVKQEVMAIILSKFQMEQRVTSFLRPFRLACRPRANRLYPTYFNSTLVTTRFSSSPNLQNLPGKADKANESWRTYLPTDCNVNLKTRKIFKAAPRHVLVQFDFKSAEPRYLATFFQRALDERDDWLLAAKARLQQRRWEKYPVLMRRKAETANPASEAKSRPIEWPSYGEDPLWQVFRRGGDPYDALIKTMMPVKFADASSKGEVAAWLKANRHVGKLAFLALGYGGSPQMLAPQLGWTVDRTREAIEAIEATYATLNPLRELIRREVIQLGEVRTLWGRPRRMNGYFQLVQPNLLRIAYRLEHPTRRNYEMDIVPLGSTQFGIQAFIKRARREIGNSGKWAFVWDASWDGVVTHLDSRDAFVQNVKQHQFNNPPFANISISRVQWIRDPDRLIRHPARLEDASRQAFNAICQATGADHLRKAMNEIDQEVIKTSQFGDVKLILTVHDSIIYEAPREKAEAFARTAEVVMSRRPDWATIDFPVEVEIGRNLGEMSPLSPAAIPTCRGQSSFERMMDGVNRLWKRACARLRTRG